VAGQLGAEAFLFAYDLDVLQSSASVPAEAKGRWITWWT
jgi:hypothetical protein